VLAGGPLDMPYAVQKAQLMTAREFAPGFPVELALKDIRLTQEAERRHPPLLHAVEERLVRTVEAGHAGDDLASVAAVD
jgi:3-hydroxyisobutyrate dehydrogenase